MSFLTTKEFFICFLIVAFCFLLIEVIIPSVKIGYKKALEKKKAEEEFLETYESKKLLPLEEAIIEAQKDFLEHTYVVPHILEAATEVLRAFEKGHEDIELEDLDISIRRYKKAVIFNKNQYYLFVVLAGNGYEDFMNICLQVIACEALEKDPNQ